jgi:hypothetical protein
VVFGALLGGMAIRAGERFHENADRQHELEKWQRSQQLNFLADQAAKDWDNWDADQQMAHGQAIGKLVGAKPKDVEQWITASKAIHGMIPQIQAVPESLGPSQRGGTVTAEPSTEPAVRGIAAPATPQFSQLPAPGETLSPAVMAPTTGGTASFGRDMTPNQMIAQQKADMAERLRHQRVAEIKGAGLGPEYEAAALAHEVGGINVVPELSARVRGETERYKVDKGMLAKGALKFFVIPGSTPGSSHVVHGRELGGKLFDETTGEPMVLPPEAEPIQKQVVPTINDAGDLTLTNTQRAIGPGNYRATLPGVGRKTQPRATSAANSAAFELSPDALDAEADYYRKTHDFSKWGMGAQAGVRQKIANRAQELDAAEQRGANSNYAEKSAAWVAGNRNQKMIRSLDAVDLGLNTVLEKSKQFSRSEIGILNDIILRGKTQLNDPKAIEFQSAVQGVIDDLASALSGGGATTDAARKQAKLIFNTGYSQGGLDAAVRSVREVMSARRAAFAAGTVYEKGAESTDERKKRLLEKYGAK